MGSLSSALLYSHFTLFPSHFVLLPFTLCTSLLTLHFFLYFCPFSLTLHFPPSHFPLFLLIFCTLPFAFFPSHFALFPLTFCTFPLTLCTSLASLCIFSPLTFHIFDLIPKAPLSVQLKFGASQVNNRSILMFLLCIGTQKRLEKYKKEFGGEIQKCLMYF